MVSLFETQSARCQTAPLAWPRIPIWKRALDLTITLAALPVVLLVGCSVALAIFLIDGRPIFFAAPRAGQGMRVIQVFKFRTMHCVCETENLGVTGGDKAARISTLGRWLRRYRLDELPQLLNVLRADMTLVGPRPPELQYVAQFPELYSQVLTSRPGITGLATLLMHQFEDRFLQRFKTAAETDAAYRRVCIPRKARLDLIYQNQFDQVGAILFDFYIICQSLIAVCSSNTCASKRRRRRSKIS